MSDILFTSSQSRRPACCLSKQMSFEGRIRSRRRRRNLLPPWPFLFVTIAATEPVWEQLQLRLSEAARAGLLWRRSLADCGIQSLCGDDFVSLTSTSFVITARACRPVKAQRIRFALCVIFLQRVTRHSRGINPVCSTVAEIETLCKLC